jgi:hypothetical protein
MPVNKIERTTVCKNLDETLSSRKAVYGKYYDQVILRADLMKLMTEAYKANHNQDMPEVYYGYIWDIMNKMSRIAVSPNHIDSWHDVQGYAKRVEESITERSDGI